MCNIEMLKIYLLFEQALEILEEKNWLQVRQKSKYDLKISVFFSKFQKHLSVPR